MQNEIDLTETKYKYSGLDSDFGFPVSDLHFLDREKRQCNTVHHHRMEEREQRNGYNESVSRVNSKTPKKCTAPPIYTRAEQLDDATKYPNRITIFSKSDMVVELALRWPLSWIADLDKHNWAALYWATRLQGMGCRDESGLAEMESVWPGRLHLGFYRRFIKNFSKLALPLSKLLQKDVEFNFDQPCSEAFKELKDRLTSTPILQAPN
ncbi:putative mitochondrial protein, partial [Mucuna pruriens]